MHLEPAGWLGKSSHGAAGAICPAHMWDLCVCHLAWPSSPHLGAGHWSNHQQLNLAAAHPQRAAVWMGKKCLVLLNNKPKKPLPWNWSLTWWLPLMPWSVLVAVSAPSPGKARSLYTSVFARWLGMDVSWSSRISCSCQGAEQPSYKSRP